MEISNTFIATLKAFVNREQDAQNSEILRIWQMPVRSRVMEGECVERVEVRDRDTFQATLHWEENYSKFRAGDTLRLSNGNPQEPICSCELLEEQGNLMRVRAGYGQSFMSIAPGNRLVLDRDRVDVRQIQLGALDGIAANPEQREFFQNLFCGRIQPSFEMSRYQRALNNAGSLGFNASQAEAFAHAYAAKNYYLIQGPPGTGKTWVLAHLASHLAQSGQRVLVTAFTHRAINNALTKIAKTTHFPEVAKIGQRHHADGLAFDHSTVSNYENLESSPYTQDSEGIILGATCFALRTRRLQAMQFDTVIFDEAGQMTLPLAMIGMLAAEKSIFIGDHMQMAPVITTNHPEEWVTKSIFETLFTHSPGTMLDITYRMNEEINHFPSTRFYNGRLKSHHNTANGRLKLTRLPQHYQEILNPAYPDVFVKVNHNNRGMRSPEEAEIAAGLAAEAIECGVPPEEIAIVAPYRAQGRLIRQELYKRLEGKIKDIGGIVVDTVERIQGQEREMIIVSLTTSDPGHAAQRAEFYFQPNRLNVAITRPRVKRIILGSPQLFLAQPADKKHQQWVGLFQELCEQAKMISLPIDQTPQQAGKQEIKKPLFSFLRKK